MAGYNTNFIINRSTFVSPILLNSLFTRCIHTGYTRTRGLVTSKNQFKKNKNMMLWKIIQFFHDFKGKSRLLKSVNSNNIKYMLVKNISITTKPPSNIHKISWDSTGFYEKISLCRGGNASVGAWHLILLSELVCAWLMLSIIGIRRSKDSKRPGCSKIQKKVHSAHYYQVLAKKSLTCQLGYELWYMKYFQRPLNDMATTKSCQARMTLFLSTQLLEPTHKSFWRANIPPIN